MSRVIFKTSLVISSPLHFLQIWEQLTTQEECFVNLEIQIIPLLESTHIKTKILCFFI